MIRVIHLLGRTPYERVHTLQEALVEARGQGEGTDALLLLEHEATITLGRRKTAKDNVLDAGEIPVVDVERGGDVTFHAPGQLVAYPILYLEEGRRDLHRHLRALEDGIGDILEARGLAPGRDPRNTGVWLPMDDGPARKVCSIGIAARRWVTWHGLALNVDVDLADFERIRPCGYGAEIITRLADHLDPCPEVHALVPEVVPALLRRLEVPWDGTIEELTLDDDAAAEALTAELCGT